MKITFPSSISLPGKSCILTDQQVIQTSASCVIAGQVLRIEDPFESDYIPSAANTDTIKFTINDIEMPGTTAPTSNFVFSSNLVSNNIDYVIDRSNYTNLITATSGTITTASATPTSTLANELTTYTISFENTHDIVQDGKFIVSNIENLEI